MAAFHLIRRADYRVMRWKNGLGATTEIAVEPPGAALDAFVWRVSIADIGAPGPFSTFPGYDRILVQTDGAPMTLRHRGSGSHRLSLLEPYGFAGELETDCTLDPPPARDFNVMVRRDCAHADVFVQEIAAGARAAVQPESEASARLIHVLRGSVTVPDLGPDGLVVAGETLLSTEATAVVATATSGSAVALRVVIRGAG